MHSCLSIDPILQKIISKLDLSAKFGVQGVSRQWKDIAIECLRHHEYLVISECLPSSVWFSYYCDEHPSALTVKNDNLVLGKQTDLEFWKRTLSLLQGVKYVYMVVRTDVERGTSFSIYMAMLQLFINFCGQSLECLCIPGHNNFEDETFPLTDSLPRVKHMILGHITPQVTKNILSACPNLQYLRSINSFTGWQMLPKGFKKLLIDFEDLDGINNLLCSPAVQSLEVVSSIKMTSEICYQSYHLSRLKHFYVTIDFDVTNCLIHLARILSFAPVLRELTIRITAFDEIESEVWVKLLSQCPTLTRLTVYLHELFDTENPRISVSLFQDDFAKKIVSTIKKLEHLHIDFHLSSDGLRLLSQLDNLKYFRHKLHTENMSYDSVFDTDSLTDFLSSSFDKKLTEYGIHIPFGQCLILKDSFYDFIDKMERKHFLRFHMRQDDRRYDTERMHPDKIPGMIYLTSLNVRQWNLEGPFLENTDKEDIGGNLLIAIADAQSQAENIFVGDTT